MKTTKTLIITALTLGAAALLGGCGAPLSFTAEAGKENMPKENREWQASRFVRGMYQMSAFFDKTEIEGMTTQQFDIKQSGFLGGKGIHRVGFPVPDSLNLKAGDIVDIYNGPNPFDQRGDDKVYLETPAHLRSQVLAVVCRRGEPECEPDSKPQLTLGWGRKMRGAHEYKGVAAEAKQRIYPSEIGRGSGGLEKTFGVAGVSSYAKKGIAADYEDPPEEQQQPHAALCDGYYVYSGIDSVLGCKDTVEKWRNGTLDEDSEH